ncbi:PAAR domain-containing protein [Pseudomonas sp. NPDC089395]|uniref:PAAR domain-containing protein n=1 Tax=Pseudomonas sp. NPDC089395 TaxID=3364460 RepID=UPI0037FA5343
MTNRMNVFGRGQGLHGDKTTTGATCLSSLPEAHQMRRGILRQGDVTTPCPACGKSGKIMEGESRMKFRSIPVATDGALVLCDCPAGRNRLIAPLGPLSTGSNAVTAKAQESTAQSSAAARNMEATPSAFMSASSGSLEPGFFIVPRSMPFSGVLMELALHDSTLPISRLKWLNPTFEQGFKAGEMFVIGDPDSADACTREEAKLMAAAQDARHALAALDFAESDFMMQYQAEIAGLLSNASQSMGVGKDMLDQGLKQVSMTLQQIEQLHQREFLRHGHLNSREFFASRRQLLQQLDGQLKAALLNKQLNLGNYERLKKSLNISTKSLVHHWSKAGGPGQIPGYATHLDKVAKLSKYLKYGGHAAIGLGATSSYLNVREVCRTGSAESCRKARLVETGSFSAGLGLGMAGSAWGVVAAGTLCAGFTLTTAGVAAPLCGILVVGGSGLAGSKIGELGGEFAGEYVYEVTRDQY